MKTKAPKRGAKLIDGGKIEIRADQSTVVTRKIRPSDRADYPELFASGAKASAGDAPASDGVATEKPLTKQQKAALTRAANKAAKASAGDANGPEGDS